MLLVEPREIVDARAEDGKRLPGRRLDPHATTAIVDAGGSHRRPTRGCLKLLQLLAERGQRLLRVARLLDRLLRPVHADLIRDVVHRQPVEWRVACDYNTAGSEECASVSDALRASG